MRRQALANWSRALRLSHVEYRPDADSLARSAPDAIGRNVLTVNADAVAAMIAGTGRAGVWCAEAAETGRSVGLVRWLRVWLRKDDADVAAADWIGRGNSVPNEQRG